MRVLLWCLLLSSILAVNLSTKNYCVCKDLGNQAECQKYSCKWNNNACEQGQCTDIKVEADCNDSLLECSWKNNACEKFTKCADYTPGTTGCALKSTKTETCRNNAANTACETAPSTCAAISTQANCTNSGEGMCVWTNNACAKFTTCTGIAQASCPNYGCTWLNNACVAPTCAQKTTSADCTYIYTVANEMVAVCKWDSNKCADSTDLTHLSSSTCYDYTWGTYTWKDNKCQVCAASGLSGQYLGIFLLSILAVFI